MQILLPSHSDGLHPSFSGHLVLHAAALWAFPVPYADQLRLARGRRGAIVVTFVTALRESIIYDPPVTVVVSQGVFEVDLCILRPFGRTL
jgi:hypothetical protein